MKVKLLQEKQKEEITRIQQIAAKNAQEHQEQLANFMNANFHQRTKDREEAIRQQKKFEDALDDLKESSRNRRVEILEIDRQIEESSQPGMMDILTPIATGIATAVKGLVDKAVSAATASCSVM